MLWEKFEGDFAPESIISRKIDLAHSTDANQRLNPVVPHQFSHHCACPTVSQKFWSLFEGGCFNKVLCPLVRRD